MFTTQFPGLTAVLGIATGILRVPGNQPVAGGRRYTLGEVNLTAGDRPSACVRQCDEHLLNSLGVGCTWTLRFASEKPISLTAQQRTAALLQPSRFFARVVAKAFAGQPIIGQMVEVNGARRQVIGITPPEPI